MEQTVKERLISFLKYKQLSQKKFADIVGVSSGYVNAIRKSIQPETLHRISMCFPELNTGWLVTGDGTMLKAEGSQNGNHDSVVNSKNFSYDKSGIPAEQFLAVVKENQRQMGQLIDTIAVLTQKLQ